MTWLLKLYPPRWRRRYGGEFIALIAAQRFSIGTAIDIIGGAIDAWTQPQAHVSRPTTQTEGETIMLAKVMRLRCAGYGAQVTVIDGLKGAAVVIVGTLAIVLVASWLPKHPYRMALMANGWLIPVVISMRFTALKGWPGRTQAIFMSVLISAIAALTLAGEWLDAG